MSQPTLTVAITSQNPTSASLMATATGFTNPRYAWVTSNGPSGAEFADSNIATPTVSYKRQGTYTHTVTVTDATGLERSASIQSTAVSSLAGMKILPSSPIYMSQIQSVQQLEVVQYDQFGNPMGHGGGAKLPVVWTVTGPHSSKTLNRLNAENAFEPVTLASVTLTATVNGLSASIQGVVAY